MRTLPRPRSMDAPYRIPAYDLDGFVQRIVACAREVGAALGPGLPIKAYEDALARLMQEKLLKYAWQYPIGIPFDGPADRGFRADFIVEGWVLLELKAVERLTLEHSDEALNYLRESGCRLCLLINFGKTEVEILRIPPSGEPTHA